MSNNSLIYNHIQIAAIPLANHWILVIHNVRQFSRVEGLQIEDWEGK
jgi:tRNA(fMet)-specific endonuclease VapC